MGITSYAFIFALVLVIVSGILLFQGIRERNSGKIVLSAIFLIILASAIGILMNLISSM
jgi:hypothetical protein